MKKGLVVKKIVYFSIIFLCIAITVLIMLKGRPVDRLSLDSITRVGADIMRDIDKLGQIVISVTPQEEMQIGAEINRMIQYDFGETDELKPWTTYVSKVGYRVAQGVRRKEILYKFQVLPIEQVNAFALPGGYIYITKGMLDFIKTESELANIIGHEITHVDAGHTINAIKYEYALRRIGMVDFLILARIGHEIYRRGYSEAEELDADICGVKLASIAKYHPYGAISAFKRMAGEGAKGEKPKRHKTVIGEAGAVLNEMLTEYFQTHPSMVKRIEQIEKSNLLKIADVKYIGKRNYQEKVSLSEKEYKDEWLCFYDIKE